jgi:hypothetical protein
MFPVFEKSMIWIEWMSVVSSVLLLVVGYFIFIKQQFK